MYDKIFNWKKETFNQYLVNDPIQYPLKYSGHIGIQILS